MKLRGPMPPWLPFIAFGLVLGVCIPAAPGWWWIAGLACAAAALPMVPRWPLAARWLVLAAAALIGATLATPGGRPDADATRLVALRGTVARVHWQGYSQGFSLDRLETLQPAEWPPPERIFVKGPALPGVRPGDLATVRGVWSVDNRGERVTAVAMEVVSREQGPRGGAWRAIDRLPGHRELAGTLLLGRGDPPERATFRSAGLAHILAVSGMHLAIATVLGWWLLRTLGIGWSARLAAIAVLVIGYTWLTHGSPATVRACVMAVAVVLSASLWREPHRLGPVALAGLVLVAWDPGMARTISFQLSFVAVLGIVTLGLDLIDLRKRIIPLQPWQLDRPIWRVLLWGMRAALDGAVIGLAATLATAPLIAWHFAQVAPWSWLISLVASIPATVALWAGLPYLGLSSIWPEGPWEGLRLITGWGIDNLADCAAWGAEHLPQRMAEAPSPLLLCAWPLLFIRLRDGRDLLLRVLAVGLLLLIW